MSNFIIATGDTAPAMSQQPLQIHLVCYGEKDLTAFQALLKTYPVPERYQMIYHTGSFRALDTNLRFDAVVSPANSYGRMDGGFDDILSRVFSPPGDYLALTHVVQRKLWEEYRGFAPPGTCTLVPFSFRSSGHAKGPQTENPWGCRVLAVCPTMRTPSQVRWEREVVYECIWTLLCAVEKWNRNCTRQEDKIKSVCMTPLATGAGCWSAKKWAAQMLLALRHFDEACREEAEWSQLDISKISDISEEVVPTHAY